MKKLLFIVFISLGYVPNLVAQHNGAPLKSDPSEKLIFALDVIRHGDRTPTISYPNASYKWPEGLGQLTAEGMRQEYNLGQAMRKRYVEEAQLLPTHYTYNTIYVRSTDYERTLMSAQCLLMGLYPMGTGSILPMNEPALPGAYQPIPIHTRPMDQDIIFLPHHKPRFKKMIEHYVYELPEWKQKTKDLQEKFKLWSSIMGSTIDDLMDVLTLGDTLFIFRLHGIPLPEGMTEEMANEIIELSHWVAVVDLQPIQVGYEFGQPLLKSIASYIQKAADSQSELKWVLYSAHDLSIAILAHAMNAPLDYLPPYASDMNFSLYEESGEYIVKVTMNNELLKIPACNSNGCTLDQFMSLQAQ